MVVFNDPVPVENPALQAVLMALEVRDAIGSLTERWRRASRHRFVITSDGPPRAMGAVLKRLWG